MRKQSEKDPVFQIKVNLTQVKPAVWRRLLLRADTSLAELHFVLNEAMGWSCAHLHSFSNGERTFVDPELEEGETTTDHEDEREVELSALVDVGEKLKYVYDFGDNWEHEIVIEKRLPVDERLSYPLCVGGERACPPEDCGGPGGYEHLLQVLAKPSHEEHDELLAWLGGYFDPASFDANRTNAAISAMYDHEECGCGHDHGEDGEHEGCCHGHDDADCCKHGGGECHCESDGCDHAASDTQSHGKKKHEASHSKPN